MIHHTLHKDHTTLLARLTELKKHDSRGAAVKDAFISMKQILASGSAVEHELFVEKFADAIHLRPDGLDLRIRAAYMAAALVEAGRHGRMTASARLARAIAILEEFTDADY